MTMFKFLASAAILSAFVATPAFAQRMIEEPGLYAFYHPNGDLGLGSARPADAMASLPGSAEVKRLRTMQMSHRIPVRRAQSIRHY